MKREVYGNPFPLVGVAEMTIVALGLSLIAVIISGITLHLNYFHHRRALGLMVYTTNHDGKNDFRFALLNGGKVDWLFLDLHLSYGQRKPGSWDRASGGGSVPYMIEWDEQQAEDSILLRAGKAVTCRAKLQSPFGRGMLDACGVPSENDTYKVDMFVHVKFADLDGGIHEKSVHITGLSIKAYDELVNDFGERVNPAAQIIGKKTVNKHMSLI